MCHDRLTAPIRGGAGIAEERPALAVADGVLPAYLARPEGGDGPGVVIIHDFFGPSAFYEDLARRLAGEGYTAVLPDFYWREGAVTWRDREAAVARAQRHDQVRAMADLAVAIAWLRGRAGGGRVGVVGFCMGGTLALLSAGRDPLPDVAVSFYGFPNGHPSWPGWPLRPLDADEVAAVRAPVLAHCGDADAGVGMDHMAAYAAALSAAGASYEAIIYPEMPHGFLTFDPASANFAASQAAMARTLAVFRERLGAGQ